MTAATAYSEIRYRLRALFRRQEVERELDAELAFHIQRETDKLIAQGLPPAEAQRRARIAFGGVEVIKDASRDSRGISWLEHAGQDLRYALRSLRRNPGFTAGVVLTLGLGIGINAAMFGIVDRLMFRTPAYLREPSMVHRVYLQHTDRDGPQIERSTQYTRYLDLKRWSHDFSAMAAYGDRSYPVGTGTSSREMTVATVSATLFDFFDARPVVGRFFSAEEDTVPVGAMVAVLGYGYWQGEYGGRMGVVGQRIHVGTADYTIIGVAPKNFVGIADNAPPTVFLPITAFAGTFRAGPRLTSYYTSYNWSWMRILARRKPGVSIADAEADLSQAYRKSWENERSLSPSVAALDVAKPAVIAGPVQAERGPGLHAVTRVAAWVSGVALIVLIIACANVANLLLARSLRRRREIALRLALGVTRRRLVLQFLTESLLLAACGAVAGLALAQWGGAVLRGLFLPAGVPAAALADGRTLGFALATAVFIGLLTGVAPIIQARRTDLVESLKSGARDGGGRRSRARTALLLIQAALSVTLLVGAGQFVQSLHHVQSLHLGYDLDGVLYVNLNERGAGLTQPQEVALRQQLLERARHTPGVEQAALGLTVPFWDIWSDNLFVTGIDSVSRLGEFTLQAGSPEYFGTVGTRILRGRGIGPGDVEHSPGIVIVSELMASTLWPGKDALGQCLRVGADTAPCSTVVGIAENIRQGSITGEPARHYYLPTTQYHPEAAVLFLRVRGDVVQLSESIRRELQPLMPGDAYLSVTPMTDIIGEQTQSWRLGATMFVAFGGLALILAAIGLYSVIAYDVAQRTHELGVRIALGARVQDVIGLVVGGGLRVVLAGVIVGAGVSLAAGRWMAPLLYAQSPHDPVVFGMVAATLLFVAVVASAIPAFRASRVDPNEALRSE